MKYFSWSNEKNESLKAERGISFEEVVFHIEHGDLITRIEHPNQNRYPGQRIFVVKINDYAYLIPYVENDKEVFLKTIFPSRNATRTYLRQEGRENG